MEDQGITFQSRPDPEAVRRQGRDRLLDREPVGERQEQALAPGHAAD